MEEEMGNVPHVAGRDLAQGISKFVVVNGVKAVSVGVREYVLPVLLSYVFV